MFLQTISFAVSGSWLRNSSICFTCKMQRPFHWRAYAAVADTDSMPARPHAYRETLVPQTHYHGALFKKMQQTLHDLFLLLLADGLARLQGTWKGTMWTTVSCLPDRT